MCLAYRILVWVLQLLLGLPEVYKMLGGLAVGRSMVYTDMVIVGPMSNGVVVAYWAPNIESMEVNSESNPLERKDAEGPSLDESLENVKHLDVDSCDSDSPKNVNNDSVSPSSRILREEDVRGVESDLVDTFEEGEIRDDSVLYNDGCIKDCMEKNLEDDAGEILGVHFFFFFQGVNMVMLPLMRTEVYYAVIALWKRLIIVASIYTSEPQWKYTRRCSARSKLSRMERLFFPSDLQIWSYYGNVKEAIFLHNALSRQTKDAGKTVMVKVEEGEEEEGYDFLN
ncbi:hypothetical protein Tco_0832388 [Tanacetum coccineum]